MSDDREALRAWLDLLGASVALKKRFDAALRARFKTSLARFDVLAALARAGEDGLRAGALSQRMMVTEGATTQACAPLIREGLVKRALDADDRRVAIFKLTRKGEKLFAQMAEANKALVDDAFAGLSPSQIKTLRRLLARLGDKALQGATRKDAA